MISVGSSELRDPAGISHPEDKGEPVALVAPEDPSVSGAKTIYDLLIVPVICGIMSIRGFLPIIHISDHNRPGLEDLWIGVIEQHV